MYTLETNLARLAIEDRLRDATSSAWPASSSD